MAFVASVSLMTARLLKTSQVNSILHCSLHTFIVNRTKVIQFWHLLQVNNVEKSLRCFTMQTVSSMAAICCPAHPNVHEYLPHFAQKIRPIREKRCFVKYWFRVMRA